MQYSELSKALPIKFYPSTATPGMHFDDDWAYNRIKSFERKVRYNQRWLFGDETMLELVSTIVPNDLKVLNCKGVEVDSIPWVEKGSGAGFKVYRLTVNLNTAYNSGANPVLYLYHRATLLSADFKAISEPIEVRLSWPDTVLFRYRNSKDIFNLWYSIPGLSMAFRIEAGLLDYQPGADTADFTDEQHDIELLSATAFDTFKLSFGKAPGVAEWALKLMNYITLHDHWTIESKAQDPLQYVRASGAKWDVNRVKGYPLIGFSIDVLPATNNDALQQTHDALRPGIVTGYNLDTGFFGGTPQNIQITEITIN